MNLRRIGAALLAAGLALVLSATPALAHTELRGSDPAAGAALTGPPQQIQLTFTEAVTLPDNPVTVTGPDGSRWTIGTANVAGAVVTAPVQPVGPAGDYVINYKVIADDGDEVTGTVGFSLTAAVAPPTTPPASTTTAPPTTTPPAATTSTTEPATPQAGDTTDRGGVPVWVWIIAAILLLVGGALVVLRLARSKSSPEKS
jgi:copper resistance protein C